MTNSVTVATISRIYIGELPYINAFIDHYVLIGVSKIYLVITNLEEELEIKKYLEAKSAGIKPIIGCELYVTPGSRFERKMSSKGGAGTCHLTVLAANNVKI
jgi:DNA polymerase III alpha subunit